MKYRVFPDCWKTGKVVLIPKGKGEKEDVDSYRPLTLLPAIEKIFEKAILTRIEMKKTSAKNNMASERRGAARIVFGKW